MARLRHHRLAYHIPTAQRHTAALSARLQAQRVLQVWVWLAQWLLLPVLYGGTSFGPVVNAWAFPDEPIARHHIIYLLTLASVLAAFAALYTALYGSDPGFLEHQQSHPGAGTSALQQLQLPGASACPYCGCLPTARSKHSKGSGQCVHKFDHFCWWLSTDIGVVCLRTCA